MKSQEIKSLFEEVFFEDKWEISESTKNRYGKDCPFFYIKRQSDRLKSKIACCKLYNYAAPGYSNNFPVVTILDDVWELSLDDIIMIIPGTSTERNPKDVGDPKVFVNLFKEKIEEYFKIKEMKDSFNNDISLMKNNPIKIIRDYKLNRLGI